MKRILIAILIVLSFTFISCEKTVYIIEECLVDTSLVDTSLVGDPFNYTVLTDDEEYLSFELFNIKYEMVVDATDQFDPYCVEFDGDILYVSGSTSLGKFDLSIQKHDNKIDGWFTLLTYDGSYYYMSTHSGYVGELYIDEENRRVAGTFNYNVETSDGFTEISDGEFNLEY